MVGGGGGVLVGVQLPFSSISSKKNGCGYKNVIKLLPLEECYHMGRSRGALLLF
jgi:hypothetical protein